MSPLVYGYSGAVFVSSGVSVVLQPVNSVSPPSPEKPVPGVSGVVEPTIGYAICFNSLYEATISEIDSSSKPESYPVE